MTVSFLVSHFYDSECHGTVASFTCSTITQIDKSRRGHKTGAKQPTERLEDGDARVAASRDGVVAHDGAVAGAVKHNARVEVVVHDVVLDAHVVAPLRRDDAVVSVVPNDVVVDAEIVRVIVGVKPVP